MLTLDLCCACSDTADSERAYDYAVDVPSTGWTSADTLFYPFTITDPPQVRTPLVAGTSYHATYHVRTAAQFGLTHLPVSIILQQVDTLGAGETSHVVRNVLRHETSLPVRDEQGRPLGDSWGSLYQYEAPIDSLTLRFDAAGYYRMLLIPSTGNTAAFTGIHSIGISLAE